MSLHCIRFPRLMYTYSLRKLPPCDWQSSIHFQLAAVVLPGLVLQRRMSHWVVRDGT